MNLFWPRLTLILFITILKVCPADLWCHPERPVWCRYQWPGIYTGGNSKTSLTRNLSNSRLPTWMYQQDTANWTCATSSVTFATMVRYSKICSTWLGQKFGLRWNNSSLNFSSRHQISLQRFHTFALLNYRSLCQAFTLSLFNTFKCSDNRSFHHHKFHSSEEEQPILIWIWSVQPFVRFLLLWTSL